MFAALEVNLLVAEPKAACSRPMMLFPIGFNLG